MNIEEKDKKLQGEHLYFADELHKALWREHPDFMRNLNAREPLDVIR